MAPLIPLLIKLASIAPVLMKYTGIGDKATKVAEDVATVAKMVTGEQDAEKAADIILKDPAKAAEFQLQVNAQTIMWDEMYLKDIQSARERDTKLAQAGFRNTRANWMFVLAIAVTFVLVVMIWSDETLNEYVKGIFTLVLGRFLGYLDNIYNFEFGTTRSSRGKDDVIEKLTKNGHNNP